MIRLGYVGVNTLLPTASKTFRLANFSEDKMLELAKANLLALESILKWNLAHQIYVFRITSGLIPFGSSPINSGNWKIRLRQDFMRIGKFIKQQRMRVSVHPGQYTVINSPNERYFEAALIDLNYHCDILDYMELDSDHKIIVHGGGAYGSREESLDRLKERLQSLSPRIRRRLVIENDDRVYSAEEVLTLCNAVGLPALFDYFHHLILPSFADPDLRTILARFAVTWQGARPEVHYSDQDSGKRAGAHSQTIDLVQFGVFYRQIADLELDVVLEVKDKQESVFAARRAYPNLK